MPLLPVHAFAKQAAVFCLSLLVSCHSSTSPGVSGSAMDVSSLPEQAPDQAKNARTEIAPTQVFAITRNWQQAWRLRNRGAWGLENLEVSGSAQEPVLRSHFPRGSASPSVARATGAPLGGAGFYAPLRGVSASGMRLSYRMRFSDNFDYVKGGKLPGLYGGDGASGGDRPDGTNGFSTRLMWRARGDGEVYAYLPNSDRYGTSIGRGTWRFQPGQWYELEQELILNQPGRANGRLRLWVNDRLVIEESNLVFRTVDTLQVEGFFFSTFFGGGDTSWATPQDVYIDFADFALTVVP